MARGSERTSRRSPKDAGRRIKKKPCALCRDKIEWVDYKDVNLLRKYMSDRGKIRARRVSGNCSQHQRKIALAIRTARELALVPYTQRTVTERGGGRSRRGERGRPRDAQVPARQAAAEGEEVPAEAELDAEAPEDLDSDESEAEGDEEDEGVPAEAEETV